MDREKLLRIRAKCKKFYLYLKGMSGIILSFLYLQNQFFQSDISSSLLVPKINAVAGIFQIFLFTIFVYIEEGTLSGLKNNFVQHIFVDIKTTLKMALPPIFLILSDELLLVASNILPNQAQSASNFMIVGVAIFTVLLLKKRFFLTQALAVYFIARGMDQFPGEFVGSFENDVTDSTSKFHGNSAIFLAIVCYGVSYVTLEKILKSSDEVSLWIRGIQLNLFIVPLSLVISFTNDWANDEPRGFFDSFNIIAWFFIIFKVAQQMMELFVIKIADSVYRCIALAAAVVIMGVMKNPFIDYEITPAKLGTALVIAGISLYSIMDCFPVWGELYEPEVEEDYREAPVASNETLTLSKGYQTVPTVSSCVSNADVYLKLIDGRDEATREP